jgi:hypothetical protein
VPSDDRAFRAQLDAADRLTGAARLAAYERLERDVATRAAPFASFGAFVAPEFVSARLKCAPVQGAYHFADLAALCL